VELIKRLVNHGKDGKSGLSESQPNAFFNSFLGGPPTLVRYRLFPSRAVADLPAAGADSIFAISSIES
jgi:hypothetical protein